MFRAKSGAGVLALLLAVIFVALPFGAHHATALDLGRRNLVLGSPLPLAVTTHTFNITLPNDPANDAIKSVQFDYCETPRPDTDGAPAAQDCTVPAGVDVSSATLQSQTGTNGFSIDSQSDSEIILSNAAGQNLAGSTIQFVFSGATNPGNASIPTQAFPVFFVRISLYQNTGGGQTPGNNYVELGAVSSGSGGVDISTEVPPILDFCATVSVGANCNFSSGNFLQLGTLNTLTTAHGMSQFAIGTNAVGGASVAVYGNTMTSGNNTIATMDTPSTSLAGISQFGINLRANSAPPAGRNPTGNGTFQVAADYDSPNLFKFKDGDVLASTQTTSNFQTFSVTYVINVDKSQPVGVYDTTITYICAANF